MDSPVAVQTQTSVEVVEAPAWSDEELIEAMVYQTMIAEGRSPGPKRLSAALDLPHEYARIQKLYAMAAFQTQLHRARRDVAGYTTDRVKALLPRLAEEMLKLALNSEDSRTQFAALKDLLDRGGTGAAQKVSLTTPAAYQQAIAELMVPVGMEAPAE